MVVGLAHDESGSRTLFEAKFNNLFKTINLQSFGLKMISSYYQAILDIENPSDSLGADERSRTSTLFKGTATSRLRVYHFTTSACKWDKPHGFPQRFPSLVRRTVILNELEYFIKNEAILKVCRGEDSNLQSLTRTAF